MSLTSGLFKGDSKLEACAALDPSHIYQGAPAGISVGDHVEKIQAALKIIDGAVIDPKELSGKRYGPSTAGAVLKFKTKRRILNYKGELDPIVGKGTIAALDKLLPSPSSTPTATPGPLVPEVVPFSEALPFLISRQPHSLAKGDLKSSRTLPLPTKTILAAELLSPTTKQLHEAILAEQIVLDSVSGTTIGIEQAKFFFRNTGFLVTRTHALGSPLASLVQTSPEFKKAHNSVKSFITDVLRAGAAVGVIDYHDLAEPKKKVPPPGVGFRTLPLLGYIGSFQGVDIFLNDFDADAVKRTYKADLQYQFFDHFGVDDSDTIPDSHGHGSPGQIALWILQHERHPEHMPFITRVVMDQSISGEPF